MNRELAVDRPEAVGPAHILGPEKSDRPGDQRRQRHRRPAGRQRSDHLVVQHALRLRALDVDNGRLTADRDRFGKRANLQIPVDRRRKRAG